MSVALIDIKEFADLATNLYYKDELRRHFKSFRERWIAMTCNKENEATMNEIKCFVERLYIANRIAYAYQYNEEINIERLRENELEGSFHSWHSLLELVSSIDYNLFTNNGREFLGSEDRERLKRLINIVTRNAMEEMEGKIPSPNFP